MSVIFRRLSIKIRYIQILRNAFFCKIWSIIVLAIFLEATRTQIFGWTWIKYAKWPRRPHNGIAIIMFAMNFLVLKPAVNLSDQKYVDVIVSIKNSYACWNLFGKINNVYVSYENTPLIQHTRLRTYSQCEFIFLWKSRESGWDYSV